MGGEGEKGEGVRWKEEKEGNEEGMKWEKGGGVEGRTIQSKNLSGNKKGRLCY